jgi:AcrR family transcriptional regulator
MPPATISTNDESDKYRRILGAAQDLFMRYGVRRVSMDDVARQAGVAKGTLYLYFDSKDALFAAIAEKLCEEILHRSGQAAASAAPLTERLVAFLDEQVGAMNRLLARSPHAAELIESKHALAALVFESFHAKGREMLAALLHEEGIRRRDAPEMFVAAAYGALRTGDLSEEAYRARLAALVSAIVTGVGRGP